MKLALIILGTTALVLTGLTLALWLALRNPTDPFLALFQDHCSTCHGMSFEGTTLGSALVGDTPLTHGDSVAEIVQSIRNGYPERGMPGWSGSLKDSEIQSLAILIAERRANRSFTDFKVHKALDVPSGRIDSEQHAFELDVVATGLDPLPFGLAPLPDGQFLVTEKKRGLVLVSADGTKKTLIEGTPAAFDDSIAVAELEFGLCWLLDVALHPNYAQNGWIYLHYTERCKDCNARSRESILPVSMNTLVRGRISDGRWVDEEQLWRADDAAYTSMPDIAAGGRIAFDHEGHVFISIGMKGPDNYSGIQDLSLPYGKVHRMHDDGRVPTDNPFTHLPNALATTWTYGHRSPQGLEFNHRTRELWGTEMGPRGGDEVNRLLPGRNHGWPLTSRGVDYDGTPVEYGKNLGIEFDLADIEQPVVDLTPSPAVSSFIFYEGAAFPAWRGNLLVGTLRATELDRMVLEENKVVHTEVLLRDLARIRDVEAGPDGYVYLLLEHASGGRIVRLRPAGAAAAEEAQT